MAKQNKGGISWSDETWNPIVGCSRVSPGCDHCWAEGMARLHYHEEFPKGWDGHVHLFPERLEQPLHWRKPRKIAVGLMGDLFHEDVPDEFIDKVFAVMAVCPQHTFQVLTKRPERMLRYFESGDGEGGTRVGSIVGILRDSPESWPESLVPLTWPFPNVWLGVTAENQAMADERIPLLLQTPAMVRFVSVEPMLGALDISRYLRCAKCGPNRRGWENDQGANGPVCPACKGYPERGLDWVICGGESGPGARPMHPNWARSLRDQCVAAGVKFHFKQFGEWIHCGMVEDETQYRMQIVDGTIMCRVGKKVSGHLLDGKEWLEFPEVR